MNNVMCKLSFPEIFMKRQPLTPVDSQATDYKERHRPQDHSCIAIW